MVVQQTVEMLTTMLVMAVLLTVVQRMVALVRHL